MSVAVLPPPLAKLRFLTKNCDPREIWEKCVALQNTWEQKLSTEEKYVNGEMEKFKLHMVVKTICTANVLEDTLPAGVSVKSAEEALEKACHKDAPELMQTGSESNHSQLLQHLRAFKHLCDPLPPLLTEDLIKETHHIMMQGLKNEQGQSVNAGLYRTVSVMAGNYAFPPCTCVPGTMARIVKEYNEKRSHSHDSFELASWLHYQVVSLHPFLDGNGRISRLLWCYSLMRDGLPFPTVLTSGHKKSQKHLVQCLQRDRDRTCGKDDNPHMTTLTVISILHAWQQFSAHFNSPLYDLLA